MIMNINKKYCFFILVLLITFVLAACTKTDEAQIQNIESKKEKSVKTAVLIGLRTDMDGWRGGYKTNLRQDKYRTILITNDEHNSIKASEVNNLLVPTEGGFSRVKVDDIVFEGWDYQLIDIQNQKKNPQTASEDKLDLFEDESMYESGRFYKIVFLNSDYISYVEKNIYHLNLIGNAGIIGADLNLKFCKLDTLETIPLSSFYGQKIFNDIKKISQENVTTEDVKAACKILLTVEEWEYMKEDGDWDGAFYFNGDRTDEVNWTLEREKGKWIPALAKKWLVTYNEPDAFYGETGELLVTRKLARTADPVLQTNNELHPAWESIKQAVPNAIDALASPKKDMVIVITPENLLVYKNIDKGLKKPALSVELNKNESVIMAETAENNVADYWVKTIEDESIKQSSQK